MVFSWVCVDIVQSCVCSLLTLTDPAVSKCSVVLFCVKKVIKHYVFCDSIDESMDNDAEHLCS